MSIETAQDYEGLRAAGAVVAETLRAVAAELKAGAEAAFHRGINYARSGAPLWAVGQAIEREVHRRGFVVLRELCGHGIGRAVHEEPSVPNYRDPNARRLLTKNLVITVEPIVSASSGRTPMSSDGWTIVSSDGSLTAHHEHTIVIRRGDPVVLTAA